MSAPTGYNTQNPTVVICVDVVDLTKTTSYVQSVPVAPPALPFLPTQDKNIKVGTGFDDSAIVLSSHQVRGKRKATVLATPTPTSSDDVTSSDDAVGLPKCSRTKPSHPTPQSVPPPAPTEATPSQSQDTKSSSDDLSTATEVKMESSDPSALKSCTPSDNKETKPPVSESSRAAMLLALAEQMKGILTKRQRRSGQLCPSASPAQIGFLRNKIKSELLSADGLLLFDPFDVTEMTAMSGFASGCVPRCPKVSMRKSRKLPPAVVFELTSVADALEKIAKSKRNLAGLSGIEGKEEKGGEKTERTTTEAREGADVGKEDGEDGDLAKGSQKDGEQTGNNKTGVWEGETDGRGESHEETSGDAGSGSEIRRGLRAAAARGKLKCWECFARNRKGTVQDCRRRLGHTAPDWTADPRNAGAAQDKAAAGGAAEAAEEGGGSALAETEEAGGAASSPDGGRGGKGAEGGGGEGGSSEGAGGSAQGVSEGWCEECGQGFGGKHGLRTHRAMMHGEVGKNAGKKRKRTRGKTGRGEGGGAAEAREEVGKAVGGEEGGQRFSAGERVVARYGSTGSWYSARVVKGLGGGSFEITWDDDDDKDRVKGEEELCWVPEHGGPRGGEAGRVGRVLADLRRLQPRQLSEVVAAAAELLARQAAGAAPEGARSS